MIMQKTRLGVGVGLLGAAIYFMGLFSGYMVAVLLAGYVLLLEDNEWLKKSAVKTVSLMVLFSSATVVVNLIPNVLSFIKNVVAVFGGNFTVSVLTSTVSAIVGAIDIIEKILFIWLGIKALNQGTIAIPVVDKLIGKYMG